MFGSFQIRLGTFEQNYSNSSHSKELHEFFRAQAEKYPGFRVYRDSLRVMPYGREDNDYFEIEKRRTLRFGRYFWSNRRLFGRIAITREKNPNLIDKAGREGLLDNKAAKIFRDIVVKILVDSADRFFGNKSEIRKISLNDIQEEKAKEKTNNDRKTFLRQEKKRIRVKIDNEKDNLIITLLELKELQKKIQENNYFDSIEIARDFKNEISKQLNDISTYSLSPIPPSLGRIETDYRSYRELELQAKELVKILDSSANEALKKFLKISDFATAQNILKSKAGYLQGRIRKWAKEGRNILQEEKNRFSQLVEEKNRALYSSMQDLLEDLRLEKLDLPYVLERMDTEAEIQSIENAQVFQPYIAALKSIKEQIDLEGLAIHSLKESIKWKKEAEKLNSLAQLGITVEIIGHEIEGFDLTMERGLKALENVSFEVHQRQSYEDVIFAHQGLSDRWRFLSPLKLSGDKVKTDLTGLKIFEYVKKFFGNAFERLNINFNITNEFRHIRLYEQPARIYPVFINLVNNSRYWVVQGGNENKEILIDFKDGKVIVADNGPGVDREDIEKLFSLFFTRKQRGGRGVGLYLCRTNLQAGGHKIRYETIKEYQVLSGANFVLELNGVKYE